MLGRSPYRATSQAKRRRLRRFRGAFVKAIDAGDGLQYTLIHTNADAGTIMSAAESEALVEYLAVRRDVLSLFESEQKDTESDEAEADEAKETETG